ncbi:MAG: hypothetical protein ACM3L6_02865 [Deltaproteobacteria bacterium]
MNTNFVYLVFLPMILFVGCVTSYEDLTCSRIRNKWIATGLLYAGGVYAAAWFLKGAFLPDPDASLAAAAVHSLLAHFDQWFVNLLIGTVTAFLLWRFHAWGAGDAKLFICYAALLPIAWYPRIYFEGYFASFLLLLAVFVPATVFFFLRSLISFLRVADFREVRRKWAQKITNTPLSETGGILLGFFAFFLTFRFLGQELTRLGSRVPLNQNIAVLLSLLLFRQLSAFFRARKTVTGIALAVLIVYAAARAWPLHEISLRQMASSGLKGLLVMLAYPLFHHVTEFYSRGKIEETTPFAPWLFLGALAVFAL